MGTTFEMTEEFRQRRTQNWMIIGFLYALFYMTRYNNAAAMPQIMNWFGWTKSDLGIFETVLPLIYGLSVLFNGPLGDKIGGKKLFLIGSIGVFLMNMCMGVCTLLVTTPAIITGMGTARHVVEQAALLYGFSHSNLIILMAIIWGINGYFQSMGAIAIVKVNSRWFHKLERGKFTGIFGILIRCGLILAFSGVPIIAKSLPLYCVWFIPAAGVAIVAILVSIFVENSPSDVGYQGFATGDEENTDDNSVSLRDVLSKILANKMTWFVLLASVMIGFVRRGTIDVWFTTYFNEVYTGQVAAYQVAAWGIALLGIAGGFVLGISSDKIFKGRRAPVICIGFIGMVVMLGIGGLSHHANFGPYAMAISLACLSFFVNGSHGIIGGAVTMDLGGKKATATATGLFDGAQYLVAGPMTGVVMGKLLEKYGWGFWQWGLIPFAVVGVIAMAFLWNQTPKDKNAGH
ncbi:MAG: Major facilitator superfamily MFS_1 [uncultured bacterium]|nr:MAG: Major facilitator superfamily MFS_1 [uncultured bacterium]